MNKLFQVFLERGYAYNYQNGPNIITSEEQAVRDGINCIGLMHLLLIRLFKTKLPPNIRVLEIINDNPYFETVHELSEMEIGDILFLGRKELPEYTQSYVPKYDSNKTLLNEAEGNKMVGDRYAGYHTVMFTGEKNKEGNPIVIDIQKTTDKVQTWDLQELMKNEKYEKLYKTKRIIKN